MNANIKNRDLLNIIFVTVVGFWFPFRITFGGHFMWFDVVADLLMCLFAFFNYQKTRSYSHLIYGLPLATLFYPIFGASSDYLFIFKLASLYYLKNTRLIIDSIEDIHPIFIRLIPLLFIVPIIVHIIACGWFLLGNGTIGLSGNHRLDYVRAVYWAITTLATVGYGDISAKTEIQMIYAALTMILGVGFFGYVLSNVSALIARLDAAREAHYARLDQIEAFMSYNQVPKAIRQKIRSYYQYLWENKKGHDDQSILETLPKKLRADVALFLNTELLLKVPIFKEASNEFKREIVLELKTHVAIPSQTVFKKGDHGDMVYFIKKGSVNIYSEDGTVLATLHEGSFFGETALLTSSARNATVVTHDYCEFHTLSRETFLKVIENYPDFKKQIEAMTKDR